MMLAIDGRLERTVAPVPVGRVEALPIVACGIGGGIAASHALSCGQPSVCTMYTRGRAKSLIREMVVISPCCTKYRTVSIISSAKSVLELLTLSCHGYSLPRISDLCLRICVFCTDGISALHDREWMLPRRDELRGCGVPILKMLLQVLWTDRRDR